MEQQKTSARMQQMCRVGEILLDIVLVCVALFTAFLIPFGSCAAVGVFSDADLIDSGLTVFELAVFCGILIIACAMLIGVCWCLRKVFRSTAKSGRPFTADNARYLRSAAIVMLVLTVFGYVVTCLAVSASLSITWDLAPLVFAFFFYLLSLMFDYGAALQRESDETL